jgi:hypothetical protein
MKYPTQNDTQFIAYVYPGWQPSEWRPGFDEWSLLDHFASYFEGHETIPRPLHGYYDDSDSTTTKRQITMAREMGIVGFTYFLYFGPHGFVMDSPLDLALTEAKDEDFVVGTTWCLKLPQNNLPITEDIDGIGLASTKLIAPDEHVKPFTIGDLRTIMEPAEFKRLELDSLLPFVDSPEMGVFGKASTEVGAGKMSNDGRDGYVSFRPEDVATLLRTIPTTPFVCTFTQLYGIIDSLQTFLIKRCTPISCITLREVEEIFEEQEVSSFPLGSFVFLIDLCTRLELGTRSAEDVFSSIRISDIAKIAAQHLGWLSINDVVSLAKLGRKVKGRNDVLEGIELGELQKHLQESALMLLNVTDLRRILEQLASL